MKFIDRSNQVLGDRREDIDLLRAIAVLAVLLFHLDIPWVQSGFLGVDVFFVISGYLITGSIVSQLKSGRFSFQSFYARRFRRLVPAFYVVLAATSLSAVFFMPASLLDDFSWSLMSSATYLSNIYFFSQAGYFDLEASAKPLLHTWSLSVEEQFYLVWPAFIMLFFRKSLPLVLLIVGIASLAAAQVMQGSFESAVFYLFPFRIFEFVAGALCVFSKTSPTDNPYLRFPALLLAFGVIFGSVHLLNPNTTLPGLVSLPVVLGTAAIILLRPDFSWLPRFLRWPLLYTGLISYSIYLVHWPLITFYKFSTGWEFDTASIALLLLATFLSASILYHQVEFRWHYGTSVVSERVSLALVPVGVAGAFLIVFLLPHGRAMLPGQTEQISSLIEPIRGFRQEAVLPVTGAADYARGSDPSKHILVIGDSLAEDVQYALWKNMNPTWTFSLWGMACHPVYVDLEKTDYQELYSDFTDQVEVTEEGCRFVHTRFVDHVKLYNPAFIVFSEHWYRKALEHLPLTLKMLQEQVGVPILLLGRNVEFTEIPQIFLTRIENIDDINVIATRDKIGSREGLTNSEYDRIMADLANSQGVYFISKTGLVCPNPYCDVYYNGAITYVDSIHWTLVGLELFGSRLVSSPTFQEFIGDQGGQ